MGTLDRIDSVEHAAYASVFTHAQSAADPTGIQLTWSGTTLRLVCPGYQKVNFHRIAGLRSGQSGWQDHLAQELADVATGQFIDVRAEDVDLARAVASHGFSSRMGYAKFVRCCTTLPSIETPLPIRELQPVDAPVYNQILQAAFSQSPATVGWFGAILGTPGWRCFGAVADEQVVAVGAMYIRGKEAWLGFDATAETYRGRKLQQALLAARIGVAHQSDVDLLTGETLIPDSKIPAPSFVNFRRNGFQIAYERSVYSADV